MELTEAVRRRHMVRAFADQPLDAGTLEALLGLVGRAPSAGGSEGVAFVVLTEAASRAMFWSHASSAEWRDDGEQAPGLLAAPVLVLVLCDPAAYVARYARNDKVSSPLGGLAAEQWPVPFWYVDAGMEAMALLLGAVDLGIGALFFHVRGARTALLAALGCPAELILVGAIALGHVAPTAAHPRAQRRRTAAVHRERF